MPGGDGNFAIEPRTRVTERVGVGRRLAAVAVDGLIVAAASGLVGITAGGLFGSLTSDIAGQTDGFVDRAMLGALFGLVAGFTAIGAVYFALEVLTDATPGKRALGLVIGTEDARPAAVGARLARYLVKCSPLLLGMLTAVPGFWFAATLALLATTTISVGGMMALGPNRQALHDVIARTAVYRRADLGDGS